MTGPITVVGGVYREVCMHPIWREIYGSAGRAATAIARLGVPVELHAYFDEETKLVIEARAALEGFTIHPTMIAKSSTFSYTHGLAVPGMEKPSMALEPIEVNSDRVVRFGAIEGETLCHAKMAVYDPQSASGPKHFASGGSTAERLALILNRFEARTLASMNREPLHEVASALLDTEN